MYFSTHAKDKYMNVWFKETEIMCVYFNKATKQSLWLEDETVR